MKGKKLNIWTASSFFIFLTYLIFLVYPIVIVLKQALIHEGKFSLANFEDFFSKSYYTETLVNSFNVSITSTVTSLVLGTLLAYLFSIYDFKGKKVLQILIIIASMSAPFVGAYSWILLLGRNGVITKLLTNALHLPAIDIYGFKGIVLVFTLQLFPLVFLYVAGAMKRIDHSLLEAAESMGVFGFKRMITVILPLLVPTLLAAALLVFMRAFSDFGTPMLIGEGYRTFPVLIYNQFISEVGGNSAFASALAIMAIIIALTIFLIQNRALCKHIVFAAVQFLQNQLSADNNHPQFKPQTSFQRFTQGRTAFEHLESAVAFIRHQSLKREIRFAFGDLCFAYFEFFQVVLRDIDTASLPIDGNILPKVDELQRGADTVTLGDADFVGLSVKVQHNASDWIGGTAAVVDQVAKILITGFDNILTECGQKIVKRLQRQLERSDGFTLQTLH